MSCENGNESGGVRHASKTRRAIICLMCVMAFLCAAVAIGRVRCGEDADWEDEDFDGFPTAYEKMLGTDPDDPESRPTLADNQFKILAYWPLATNAVEAFGSDLNGNVRHGARFLHSAVVLDGRDDYINFGDSSSLSVTGDLSWCVWIRPAVRPKRVFRILGKFSFGNRKQDREHAAFFGARDRIWVTLSDNGTVRRGHSISRCTRKGVIKRGDWQHVALTWDSLGDHNSPLVYVNGKKRQMRTLVASTISSIHAGHADFTLGAYDVRYARCRRSRKKKEHITNPFKGSMSQLILCNGLLTDLEIREIHALGRHGDLGAYIRADYDDDNLPDCWERLFFGDVRPSGLGDVDGDGLTQLQEFELDSDPTNPDTDGDQIPDGWEASRGLNPCDPADAAQDRDGDGGSNLDEYLSGVDPNTDDADNDGMRDEWERQIVDASPSDAIESIQDVSPTDDYDNDGWDNMTEFMRGGNPVMKLVPDTNNTLRLVVMTPLNR